MSTTTEHVICNLCGADASSTWGHKDGIRIAKCKRCGLIYSDPRPTLVELEKYYAKEYFEDGDYQGDKLRERMYEYEISKWLPLVGEEGRFLDVGCAMGKFLHVLPNTFEKYGIEFSEEAADSGRREYGLNIRTGQLSQIGIEQSFYDIVQMRGVIEHLQDPAREVAEVNKALKPNGWFLINMTPNVGGLSGRIYRDRFNQVFPREHLYYFNRQTLGKLLAKAGFSIKHIHYPYIGTPYANPLMDAPRFIWNRLTGKDSPPFWGNMMAIYSQKAQP